MWLIRPWLSQLICHGTTIQKKYLNNKQVRTTTLSRLNLLAVALHWWFFFCFSLGLLKTRDTKSGVRDRAIFSPHSLNSYWPNGLFMLISGVLRKLLGILMLILSVFTFFCADFFEAEITLVLTLTLFSYLLLENKSKTINEAAPPIRQSSEAKSLGQIMSLPMPIAHHVYRCTVYKNY